MKGNYEARNFTINKGKPTMIIGVVIKIPEQYKKYLNEIDVTFIDDTFVYNKPPTKQEEK